MEKPPYGSPCNGCGVCCQNEICPLGQIAFPHAQAPCPALEKQADRYVCGLVASPQTYAPIRASVYGVEALREAAAIGVGADIGCDTRMMPDEASATPPPDFVKAMLRVSRTPRSVTRRIEKLWTP